jgi:hypothetical protein
MKQIAEAGISVIADHAHKYAEQPFSPSTNNDAASIC